MSHLIKQTAWRELTISLRNSSEILNLLLFFTLATVFVPFAVGNDPELLARLAPGVIWVMALMTTLLSLERIFARDDQSGALDQMILTGESFYVIVLLKTLIHWLTGGFALSLISPALGLMLSLPAQAFGPLVLTLLVGSLGFSFLGAIGAAMTLSLKRGAVLLNLVVMPLYVPILIYGAGVVRNAVDGLSYSAPLQMLIAITLMSIVVSSIASPWLVKISREA